MLPSVQDILAFSDCGPSQRHGSADGSVDSESTDESSRGNGTSSSKRRPGRRAGSSDRYPVTKSVRQYRCGVHSCAAVFKRPEHLKRHMLTHTQVRPFQCEAKGCGKRFSRRDNYITHTKKHLLDPECPDTVSHRRTCSDLNSGSSTTGSNTPARAESPAQPAVSSIFGLLNDCPEEEHFRPDTRQSWPSSSRTGSASPGKSHINTPVPAVFSPPVLPPLELLAQASLQSEAPPPQLIRQVSRPLAVRVSLDGSSNAVTSFVEAEHSLVHQLWTPTGDGIASSSVEQFSATVVAGDPAKPFMCSLCGSRFGRVEHVKRHHLVHTGQRKYECRVCLKPFARKDNMVQHLRSHERKDDVS
ncbi:hypothetical protein GGI19_002552 [Coemansia pectinata]|uniref:C2H2-type domain-containing protein n=1 Tax=Coemansia pectinata TaxID=1052879 RepID=A0A9W8LA82_9FUNG|nr:hypothetical protein GGI19_002552 [Coemansia pectinata]